MISRKQDYQKVVQVIHADLLTLINGMDYCLDWKPQDADWSVRELVYHLLETPPVGVHAVVSGTISGEITEYEIWSNLTNLTSERSKYDMEQVAADIDEYFGKMNEAFTAVDEGDLEGRSVIMHQRTKGCTERQTLNEVLSHFARHWRDHLLQVQQLRDALGF